MITYRFLLPCETVQAGDLFGFGDPIAFATDGYFGNPVVDHGVVRIGRKLADSLAEFGPNDTWPAYVRRPIGLDEAGQTINSQNTEIVRLRQLLANQSTSSLQTQLDGERVARNDTFNALLNSQREKGELVAKLDVEREAHNRTRTELHSTEMNVALYKREYQSAVDACAFLQGENLPGFLLGRRCTVEGVAALRVQRDALRSELKDAKAELAILRPRDAAYYLRIQRLETSLREAQHTLEVLRLERGKMIERMQFFPEPYIFSGDIRQGFDGQPGAGWRLLGKGECIEEGDEVWRMQAKVWVSRSHYESTSVGRSIVTGDDPVHMFSVRRRK